MKFHVAVMPERIEWARESLERVGAIESFSQASEKAELLAMGGRVAEIAARMPEPDGCFVVEAPYEGLMEFFGAWLEVGGVKRRELVPSGIHVEVLE